MSAFATETALVNARLWRDCGATFERDLSVITVNLMSNKQRSDIMRNNRLLAAEAGISRPLVSAKAARDRERRRNLPIVGNGYGPNKHAD